MAEAIITDNTIMGFLIILGMLIMYLIIREIRIMKTSNRKIELELEKDKLDLLRQHEAQKGFPFTRLSAEQTAAIRTIEEENESLETSIFSKQKLLDVRLARLENMVKDKKLDSLLAGAEAQERKVK